MFFPTDEGSNLPLDSLVLAMMGIAVPYIWPLLLVALRCVAAIPPPPQEPLSSIQSTPVASSVKPVNLPLVVWHGLGDKYVIRFASSSYRSDCF